MRIERIVVGVDGSANAEAAVRWAAGLAEISGAEVVAVHALGLLERMASDEEPVPAQKHRDEVQRRLENEWCAPLRDAGVRWRSTLRDGSPVTALLAAAEDETADLVVVGSRGLGGFPELLLGSTSTQVAQHSTRPVMVVPNAPS
jgi:nucleotide-binding universal stress UspA family protein